MKEDWCEHGGWLVSTESTGFSCLRFILAKHTDFLALAFGRGLMGQRDDPFKARAEVFLFCGGLLLLSPVPTQVCTHVYESQGLS